MNEKQRFAERLRAAMIRAGYEPRANVLETNFNTRYWGRAVTYQAARRWLKGLSIPEQDKLQVLAEWLAVHPQALRFGEQAVAHEQRLRDARRSLAPFDSALIDALLQLPMAHRRLIGDLVRALAAPDGEAGRTSPP